MGGQEPLEGKTMRRWRLFAGAKYLFAGACAAGVFVASSEIVRADGMAPRGAPVVQQAPTSWSGFYFGAQSGFQWSDFDASYPAFGTSFSVSHDAFVVGGLIGIQHQFGNVVLGVEGNLIVAYRDDYASTNCPNTTYTCAARFDDVLTIGPRIGWAMGKWMPYITGGYANAAFTEKEVLKSNNNQTFRDRERHSGWYIGGGVDMAVAAGWTIGLEYRHYEFDNATYNPSCAGIGGACTAIGQVVFPTDANTADPTSDIVTLRVSWKLDRPAPVAAPMK
jgi:opacity protein-like surface antigen